MIRSLCLATSLLLVAAAISPVTARERTRASLDANGNLDMLISKYASENGVPEALVRRVIKRERSAMAAAPPACSMPRPT